MHDPLDQLHTLSGVNTLAILTKDNKRIVLLGDQHTPYKGLTCPDCHKDCFTVKRLIRSLATYHTKIGTDFDLFGEFYAPFGDSKNTDVLKNMIKITKLDEEYAKKDPIILFEMRKEFARESYIHKATTVRFHYVDMRTSPYIQSKGLDILSDAPGVCNPDVYYRLFKIAYPTKAILSATIIDICFESKDPENKISKQYRKLPISERRLVRGFIEKRINAISKHFSYSDIRDYVFWLKMLLVDSYTICRFLRFFAGQQPGSTTVFLEGAAHTWTVLEFLKLSGCDIILNTHPKNVFDMINMNVKMSKCIHTDNHFPNRNKY